MDWFPIADAPMPAMDLAYWMGIVSRMSHLLAAGVLVGGLAYLKQVVAPLAMNSNEGEAATLDGAEVEEKLYRGQRGVWSQMVMLATFFLLTSGLYNYMNTIGNENLPGAYHAIFGIKFLLAMFVLFVAAATAGKTPLAVKMRANLNQWLNRSLVALLAIFLLGAMLRSIDKTPRQLEPSSGDEGNEEASTTLQSHPPIFLSHLPSSQQSRHHG